MEYGYNIPCIIHVLMWFFSVQVTQNYRHPRGTPSSESRRIHPSHHGSRYLSFPMFWVHQIIFYFSLYPPLPKKNIYIYIIFMSKSWSNISSPCVVTAWFWFMIEFFIMIHNHFCFCLTKILWSFINCQDLALMSRNVKECSPIMFVYL